MRGRIVGRIGCVLLAGAVLSGCFGSGGAVRVSGQIEGHAIAVGSRVGGRVSEVLAREGEAVAAGAPLLRFEPFEAQADVAAAEAGLAQAQAELAKREAGARPEAIRAAQAAADAARAQYDEAIQGARSQEISAARAKAEAARAEMEEARGEHERQAQLYAEKVVAFNVADHARLRLEAAQNRLNSAREEFELLLAGTRDEQIAAAKAAWEVAVADLDELQNGYRAEDVAAARAARDLAAAQLEGARIALRECEVSSPIDGIVETLDVRPGDLVRAGPVARVMDPEDLELTVFVSAALLGKLAVGDTLTFTTDSHGNEAFEGVIEFISGEGAFTPRNLQTEEDRVQQVFAIKLRIDSANGKLRPGMTGTVRIDTA